MLDDRFILKVRKITGLVEFRLCERFPQSGKCAFHIIPSIVFTVIERETLSADDKRRFWDACGMILEQMESMMLKEINLLSGAPDKQPVLWCGCRPITIIEDDTSGCPVHNSRRNINE